MNLAQVTVLKFLLRSVSNICFYITSLQKENIFTLYKKFGSQFKTVLENTAVDILTEEATKYSAYEFFWDRGQIKEDFQVALDTQLSKSCYTNIKFLQLKTVDLPDPFEMAIQQSEVKKQDIQKATAELNRVTVQVDTLVKSAEFQKEVTVNRAQGKASEILTKNVADVESMTKVANMETDAYAQLKTSLLLDNKNFIKIVKSNIIRDHQGDKIAIGLDRLEQEKPGKPAV